MKGALGGPGGNRCVVISGCRGVEETGAATVEGVGHEEEVEEDDGGETEEEEEEGYYNHHDDALQKEEEEFPLAPAEVRRRCMAVVFSGESWHVGRILE